MRKPLFLDRDGVLNVDVSPYLARLDQLQIFPWTVRTLVRLYEAGYDLYVISNQQGVALGITSPEELTNITNALKESVRPHGVEFKKFFYCTAHDGEQHPWRKPNPGMILAAAEEFGFDPTGAFLIGDWWKDMAAARAAGCRPLLVPSGVCKGDEWQSWGAQPEAVFPTLVEAADYVIAEGLRLEASGSRIV
jgi:D-glycero-D-manno-heptose 1,7-bisphosphate phosphatase